MHWSCPLSHNSLVIRHPIGWASPVFPTSTWDWQPVSRHILHSVPAALALLWQVVNNCIASPLLFSWTGQQCSPWGGLLSAVDIPWVA
eukprot:13400361-Ditylum_brightwellii.AAC.2